MTVLVFSDGYVGEDGIGGWAFVVRGAGVEASGSGMLSGASSHLAEWTAVANALAWCEEHLEGPAALEIRTDAALVAKGLAARRPEMHGEAAALRAGCRQALARLAKKGVRAHVVRVPREENGEADALAREAANGTRD